MTITGSWTPTKLEAIAAAGELEITTRRRDGSLRGWLPIWAVRVGDAVYVRTWHQRTTGWYGRAVAAGAARVRVPGLEGDVVVEYVGTGDAELRTAVHVAYGAKYDGGPDDRMVRDEAAATTLRLLPRI